jgi:uncharacterized membrane protein YphA (DoxX/SURF4 family)
MKIVPTLSAWFLAAVFLFAGIDKAVHYDGFVNALRSYVVIPAAMAEPLAPAVILVELWIGIGLLAGAWRPRAALAGAAVLGIFTVALAVNQTVAPGSVCGCWFTVTLAKSTGAHVLQNLVLLGLALTVWKRPSAGTGGRRPVQLVAEAS